MLSRNYSPMEPEHRRAIEKNIGKRFYKPMLQIRTAGDAIGAFFLLAGFAILGVFAGVIVILILMFIFWLFPGATALNAFAEANALTIISSSAVLGAFGIPLWMRYGQLRTERARAGRFQADLADGRVEVVAVQASAAARCEAMEGPGDEPKAFFMQIGAAEVLFLQGDYLEQALRAKKFPNSEFEVIRGAKSGMGLAIRCLGKPLALAKHDYSDITDEEFYYPSDGEVLSATLETLPESLRRLRS